jgi:hypothetical protein
MDSTFKYKFYRQINILLGVILLLFMLSKEQSAINIEKQNDNVDNEILT